MKLNKFFKYGVLLSTALVATSCGDSYLDEQPRGDLSEEAVRDVMAKDPDQINAFVNGAFMNLYNGGQYATNHDVYGFYCWRLATDLMVDDIAFTRNIQWFSYDYQLDNRLYNYRRVVATWRELYQVIDNANNIITLMKPGEGETVTETFNRKVLGQAYGLRGLCYYWLINLYQQPYAEGREQLGVPIKTEDEYLMGRNTVGQVYDLICSDCETALAYFDGLGMPSNKSDLCEYSVAGIYANVLMQMGDYNKAKTMAVKATQGGPLNGSQLLDGMNSLSMDEALWGYAVNSENTNYYACFGSHMDTYMIGYGGNVGYRKEGAQWLVDKIADTDIRKGWFGYKEEYNLLGVDFSYEKNLGFLPYLQNKFRDVYLTTEGAMGPFESDYIWMRSAEFWFVAAEAAYLAGDQAEASRFLNTIMVTRDPQYAFNGTGDELYEEICLQKRIETWGEGVRFNDARRRNEFIQRSLSVNHANAQLAPLGAVDYSARSYKMIYQIPSVELENNPEIPSSDQNP
ncbi:MAG: RagB/SusD family nutrient uptake outer membrane protein [Paramuribaculum sp.]|nr:RagB/SusD family nutrient uptake outer membrane protein [Paramuribaculum sp.]